LKLKYIVNANLNGNFARSVQINSNSSAFSDCLGEKFECVAVGDNTGNYKHIWVNNIVNESSKLRKLLFHTQIIIDVSRADVVYSRNLSVLWLANILGKETVWEIHDAVSGTNMKIFEKLSNKIKVVAISEALKKYLLQAFQIEEHKILVAHDGVFLEKYDAQRDTKKSVLRAELDLPVDKTIVMHTGSLFAGRGAELFDSVIRNFPELCFVQVGGKPADIKCWQEHYRDFSNITFIGHQDNSTLVKYQLAADLMFLPMTKASSIWWCTSPMKLFEYMATGNPICTSRLGSLCEVVDENNSLQFDPENEQTIISAIQYFMDNREACTKLGAQCLTEVRKNYSWQNRVDKICRFIF
jgi:glycosyltransferase involved in cell wall biosynthesis